MENPRIAVRRLDLALIRDDHGCDDKTVLLPGEACECLMSGVRLRLCGKCKTHRAIMGGGAKPLEVEPSKT